MAGISGKDFSSAIGGEKWLGQQGGPILNQQYDAMRAAEGQATPFYSKLASQGLPFYRNWTDFNAGNIAQAYAPMRAQILRQSNQMAYAPSGYRDALLNSLRASQARDFDSTLMQAQMANQQAKAQGAAGLTGQEQIAGNMALGGGSMVNAANQTILGSPQKPSTGSILGGVASAGLSAAAAF